MGENLARQILRDHLVVGELKHGSPIGLRVDQTLLQDATGTMAFMQFEQLGIARVRVDRRSPASRPGRRSGPGI
jgi:aconitate hydratase